MAKTELKAADLYNESNPKVAAERHEEYTAELGKALSAPRTFNGETLGGDVTSQIEALVANKSLTPDAVAGLNNAAFQNAVKRYGNVMRGQGPLSSPTIASRLGCPSSSSIMKTLIRFAQLGIIEDCGREKHIGHGKPPRLWRWIKD